MDAAIMLRNELRALHQGGCVVSPTTIRSVILCHSLRRRCGVFPLRDCCDGDCDQTIAAEDVNQVLISISETFHVGTFTGTDIHDSLFFT